MTSQLSVLRPMKTAGRGAGRLRVCHVGKYYPPAAGGMEAHVRTLARAQADLGAHVRVLCVNHRSGPMIQEQDGAVEVVRFRRLATVAKLDLCLGLVSTLTGIEADILHVHVPNPTMILALLLAGPLPPIVVTYHSDHVRQRIRRLLFRPIERRFYRRVRALLATSPAYPAGSEFLQDYLDRLQVLPHGIDLEPFLEPSAADQKLAADLRRRYPGPLWLTCGRLTYYKGLIHALRALTRLPGTLLIVGDGPERGLLENEKRRLALDQRVVFAGSVPSVVPYFLAAFALWFPSNARSEAFGLVQLEAMAAGRPVINTDIPHSGVTWVSRHEETGLTVPMNDADALARAANRLRADPELYDRLSWAARERACSEFDHRIMGERSLQIYQQVLTGAPSVRLVRVAA